MEGIKKKQFSCYAKDLPEDERPDYMSDPSYVPAEIKASIKDALFAGLEDESLQRYKESLLGDLEDIVSMKSTNLDAKLDPPFVEVLAVEIICPTRP